MEKKIRLNNWISQGQKYTGSPNFWSRKEMAVELETERKIYDRKTIDNQNFKESKILKITSMYVRSEMTRKIFKEQTTNSKD